MQRKEVRLLLVQEPDSFRTMLLDWIELSSHHYYISIRTAETGNAALELLNTWFPSVVVIDAHLTDLNCFTLIDECKRSCIPVFVTSKEQSTEIELSAQQSGASGYFPAIDDPIMMDQLLAELVEASEYSLGVH